MARIIRGRRGRRGCHWGAAPTVLLLVGLPLAGCASAGNVGAPGSAGSSGKHFTIGFTNPLASNDLQKAVQDSLVARANYLGDRVIALDANLQVDKQVSDIDQLISRHVDAIIIEPIDGNAVLPAVARAQAAGIKVIGTNSTLGKDPNAIAPYNAVVDDGHEQMAEQTAQFVVDRLGGRGNVLGIDLGAPVPVIQYQMSVMKRVAVQGGLTWLGTVSNPTDDAAGAEPVVRQALLRFPQIDAIMAYNDNSAIGAVTALRAAGRTTLVTGANGSTAVLPLVRQGAVAATWDQLPWEVGVAWENVTHRLLEGNQVPNSTTTPVKMFTKDNIDSRLDWSVAIQRIRAGLITN